MSSLEEVYLEWQNNPEFRDAFKHNPNEALKAWGFKLNEIDFQRILKIKQDNEELDKRDNK